MSELIDEDVRSLEHVYRAHYVALTRLAYLLCSSRELSEDVVQSAFASAHARWSQIDDHRAYLRRSVVNLVNDAHRRRLRPLRAVRVDDVTEIPEVDETWAAVQQLPGRQRAVVVLHYYEDLPLVEIAAVLGRPASTVRSDLKRALARLRKDIPWETP